MKDEHKGILFGALAAIFYGTNPLGALNLIEAKLIPISIIFYRMMFATLFVLIALLVSKKSLKFPKENLPKTISLGILFAASACLLYESFIYMEAGIASTMLFLYPVFVALLMLILYKEKLTKQIVISILVALVGVAFLTKSENGFLSVTGIILVLLSSLTYSFYMIIVARLSKPVGSLKLNFYVLLFGTLGMFLFTSFAPGHELQKLPSFTAALWTMELGFVPTLLSLIFMVKAIKIIGSTKTAILGALEPLTAVCVGVFIFHESFTWRLCVGIILILSSVIMIAVKKKN